MYLCIAERTWKSLNPATKVAQFVRALANFLPPAFNDALLLGPTRLRPIRVRSASVTPLRPCRRVQAAAQSTEALSARPRSPSKGAGAPGAHHAPPGCAWRCRSASTAAHLARPGWQVNEPSKLVPLDSNAAQLLLAVRLKRSNVRISPSVAVRNSSAPILRRRRPSTCRRTTCSVPLTNTETWTLPSTARGELSIRDARRCWRSGRSSSVDAGGRSQSAIAGTPGSVTCPSARR